MDVRDYKTFTYIMYKTRIDEEKKSEEEHRKEASNRADEDKMIKEELKSIQHLPPQVRDIKRKQILEKFNRKDNVQQPTKPTSFSKQDIDMIQDMLEDEGIDI